MEALTPEIALYLAAAGVIGVLLGWLFRGANSKRSIEQLNDEWQVKLDDVVRQRDRLTVEAEKLRSTIETQQGVVNRHEITIAKTRTDLESAYAKEKLMSKDLFNLRAEREGFKEKMAAFQNALSAVRQQSAELQQEFLKSGEVYKRELQKAFEKRKALEIKIDNAKLEHESFSNLLQATRSEQESVNKMLDSARNRLANLDTLEQNVVSLEAENAQLNHDFMRVKQENEGLLRDVAELEELRVQNKELSHCLKSMESSRRQHEEDAKRYRENAHEYERHSETLRMQLDEVEKHFADMEKQQRQALKEARAATDKPRLNGHTPPKREADNLQEIVGIGKVFEQTLHELGIYTFEQIANFGVSDIARVNAELKEFKGRMEQDDWIGQAKELHYKKHAAAD
jgi:predicted flap endonuclease-1-like 5' DNA nuclease/predicted  nucleic acid-binding Zn-ribbon protein